MKLPAIGLMALVACGCAKFPDSGNSSFTKRLVFTARVERKVRSGLNAGESGLPYVYLVGLRLSKVQTPTDDGPLPVVQALGNGFVAGNCTHYVLWNPLSSPAYQIWQFRDATLNESFLTGTPVNSVPVPLGGDTLQFEIDMSQLVPATEVSDYKSVQINVLSVNDRNALGSNRVWDALGDGRIANQINSPVLVRLDTAQTYSNATTSVFEPDGDTADPDLDFVDWSVEVRLP